MGPKLLLVALAIVALLLAGCAYQHKAYPKEGGPLTSADDFILQVDDYGQFWDPKEPERALARIRTLRQTTNVIVVLFVHGWNHNAAPDNGNLQDFGKVVTNTRTLLGDPARPESAVYRESRHALTCTEALSVVSIYVGWRGRSLPGVLNYLTFWGRKAAAERVGQGDLREFLVRLNGQYREHRDARAQGKTPLFMGLTTFGHSFGGQVLFKGVAHEIENELIARTTEHARATATTGAAAKPLPVEDLTGFGDLVVLVNPALEAMQFERIWHLSRGMDFGPRQNPVFLVVSSGGDWPRQILFPLGRHLDALWRPGFREGQRALWTQALGEYEPFRTHELDILGKSKDAGLVPGFDPRIYVTDPAVIAGLDLSNVPAISGVRLSPTANHPRNHPFMVAYASTSVVLNHHEVFEDTLRQFLNDYIALAQGKRMITGGLACPRDAASR